MKNFLVLYMVFIIGQLASATGARKLYKCGVLTDNTFQEFSKDITNKPGDQSLIGTKGKFLFSSYALGGQLNRVTLKNTVTGITIEATTLSLPDNNYLDARYKIDGNIEASIDCRIGFEQ